MVNNKELIVAIDIGTSNIVAVAGYKDFDGKIEIVGVVDADSKGVLKGGVSNIEHVSSILKKVVSNLENKIGVDISKVNINIGGEGITTKLSSVSEVRSNDDKEIDFAEVEELLSKSEKLMLRPGERLIHVVPKSFSVDKIEHIVDPVGLVGHKIEAFVHLITGQVDSIKNSQRTVEEKVGLKLKSISLSGLASAESVLRDDEKEAGIVLIDIGKGTTDISIYRDNVLQFTSVIPLGGEVITSDIRKGCKILDDHAEKLKVGFGSAFSEEVDSKNVLVFKAVNGDSPKRIKQKFLSQIIESRVKEILNFALSDIKRYTDLNDMYGGVVITGGSANLENIDKLVEYHWGTTCRIGQPIQNLVPGRYPAYISNPKYSTAIGLLLLDGTDLARNLNPIEVASVENNEDDKSVGFGVKMFTKIKDFFALYEDEDFS